MSNEKSESVIIRDWTRPKHRYVVDTASGKVSPPEHPVSLIGKVAGVGKKRVAGHPVVVYKRVARGAPELILQSGETKLSLTEGKCHPILSKKGWVSKLEVRCPDGSLTMRNVSITRDIISHVDPAYDAEDHESEDFLLWLDHLIRDEDKQSYLLGKWA